MELNPQYPKRRRSSEKLTPERPFSVEFIGMPRAGKSTIITAILAFLEARRQELCITAVNLSQDNNDPADLVIRGLRQAWKMMKAQRAYNEEMLPEFHKFASTMFQAIFKWHAFKARIDMHDLLLFEHGPYFTWIVETEWAGVSEAALTELCEGVAEPDLVIYLPMKPEKLRARHTRSSILLDVAASRRIYEKMEATAERKDWVRVERRATIARTAQIALGEILCRYAPHLRKSEPQQQFIF